MGELYDALIASKLGSKAGFKPTEEQLEAMNSGIDAEKVAQIGTNKDNISSLQGEIQTNNITLTAMNDYAAGTVKTGYIDNIAGITGYVTIRTYPEPNNRKLQIIEAQDGTTMARYYNGTTWGNFTNSLSAKVDSVSDVVSVILTHGAQSWGTVQAIVRAGLAPEYYPVGTILYDNWNETTGTAFRVVGYDVYFDDILTAQGYTHSMLLYEEAIDKQMQFDAAEAWLYAEQAIPAGTYRFTIPNYYPTSGGNKTYIFTSTADVPVGGQLTITWEHQQLPTKVQGYASSSSATALFDVNITEWNETDTATDLGTIKMYMDDADSSYGKMNNIARARYGSDNYYQSGLRQWLNTATVSDWWQPTNIFDRPYADKNIAGRLSALNSDFVSKLATPNINFITNNAFEYGEIDGVPFELQTVYNTKDKMFMLTHTELGLSVEPNVGNVLPYYVGADNAKRVKRLKTNNTAVSYWLRPPVPATPNTVRLIAASGDIDTTSGRYKSGVAAACVIQ